MDRLTDFPLPDEGVHQLLTQRRLMTAVLTSPSGRTFVRRVRYAAVDRQLSFIVPADTVADGGQLALFAEDGDEWADLRGVELVGRSMVVTDEAHVERIRKAIEEEYGGPGGGSGSAASVEGRVAVILDVESRTTWSHPDAAEAGSLPDVGTDLNRIDLDRT